MAGNGWRIPRALRKSGMSDRISTKEGTLISIVDVEVFMRFSFRSVVWQPYSNGKRPPALTLNRPCPDPRPLIPDPSYGILKANGNKHNQQQGSSRNERWG